MHENQNKSLVKLLLDVILTSIIDLCVRILFSSFLRVFSRRVLELVVAVLCYYSSVIFDIYILKMGLFGFSLEQLIGTLLFPLGVAAHFHVVSFVVLDVVLI